MSTLLGLSPFVAGPALGPLSAIALGYTRLWHIILGALATGLGWHTRMLALTILAGFAALIGATVALVRHLLVDGQ